jgi:hypothetical protein
MLRYFKELSRLKNRELQFYEVPPHRMTRRVWCLPFYARANRQRLDVRPVRLNIAFARIVLIA